MTTVDFAPDSVVLSNARPTDDLSKLVPPSRLYFFRALELAPAKPNGFGRGEVEQVEAAWELVDGDWISCGYVVALRDGRRAYLQYDFGEHLREDEIAELVEMVEVLPVAAERYPQLQGGGIKWTDDVGHLNDHLAP